MKSLAFGERPGCGRGRSSSGHRRDQRRQSDRPGQRREPVELPVDRLGQGERVQLIPQGHELSHGRDIRVRRGLHPLERRAGRVVQPAQARTDALLADELDRGQEEVLEQPELVAIGGSAGRQP